MAAYCDPGCASIAVKGLALATVESTGRVWDSNDMPTATPSVDTDDMLTRIEYELVGDELHRTLGAVVTNWDRPFWNVPSNGYVYNAQHPGVAWDEVGKLGWGIVWECIRHGQREQQKVASQNEDDSKARHGWGRQSLTQPGIGLRRPMQSRSHVFIVTGAAGKSHYAAQRHSPPPLMGLETKQSYKVKASGQTSRIKKKKYEVAIIFGVPRGLSIPLRLLSWRTLVTRQSGVREQATGTQCTWCIECQCFSVHQKYTPGVVAAM
ncbi:hypothetical protein EDD15DRAFT_2522523 [Pisolithus albus]|nr:hypothetical protein EDD15DRAFT_2522523 [Pisolithus albus]